MNRIKIFICLFFLSTLNAEASEHIRLGIVPFLSRTSDVSAKQAAQVTDIITRCLNASQAISVIERERLITAAAENGLVLSAGTLNKDSAAKIGQLSGCKYILLGSVTHLSQKYEQHSIRVSFMNYQNKNIQETTAALEARIIDTATGKVILSISKNASVIQELGKINSDEYSLTFSKIKLQAIEAAASRLCDKIREFLADEYAVIISIDKKNIMINRGRTSGVNVGNLYRVYKEGDEILDLNGNSLGKKIINLAVIRVTNVQREFSTAEILNNDNGTAAKKSKSKRSVRNENTAAVSLIHEGDKIEAVSFSEIEKLKLSSQI